MLDKLIGSLATFLCGFALCFPFFYYPEAYPGIRWAVIIVILSFTLPATYVSYTFTCWVPTRTKDLDRVCSLASLQPGEKFYELGCADARVSIFLGSKTKAQCIGIELSPFHFLIGKIVSALAKLPNLHVRYGDLFNVNLHDADVVYVYGCPYALAGRFREKLSQELKKGARIISYAYPIAGLEAERVDKPDEKSIAMYLYRKN